MKKPENFPTVEMCIQHLDTEVFRKWCKVLAGIYFTLGWKWYSKVSSSWETYADMIPTEKDIHDEFIHIVTQQHSDDYPWDLVEEKYGCIQLESSTGGLKIITTLHSDGSWSVQPIFEYYGPPVESEYDLDRAIEKMEQN